MATTATEQTRQPAAEASLRWGSWLMGIAAVGFIGYAVVFLVRNFTDSFLELGIGPHEVPVSKDATQQFSPELFHYISHLHIAVSGFIAATGLAVALPAHYPYHFDTLGHLGLIYLATVIFMAGALLALRGIIAQHRL